jgi:sulfur carrier protein
MSIQVTVNGKAEGVPPGSSLLDVLLTRGISGDAARGVAVAVNDRIVRKVDWEKTPVEAGAHIEIVTARQGG